ncbi:hypothetical protein CK203_007175 [Vitis vinifera]|uniref:Uncharacterized protein n=1 Tax=Vitis vinifera TaxID=29760 RepID=A0A438KCW8_VITVI|nr:hypothetical protein CK203_007175 [Vitis vinifera]
MAQNPNSLLPLLRRLSSQNPNPNLTLSFFLSHLLSRPFSTIPSATPATTPSTTKPSSLSSRLSFVFDQIDQIEKERQSFEQKDQVLQRIRAWRESKPSTDSTADPDEEHKPEPQNERRELGGGVVELAHPWKEWVELMERLVQQNYFDHRRKDEDGLVESLGFGDVKEVVDDFGFDFTRDWKTVQTACLNFGRDRFDILRSLSRQDIQILVGYGCPSTDRKLVFSAKLLRKLVHLDEGDVVLGIAFFNQTVVTKWNRSYVGRRRKRAWLGPFVPFLDHLVREKLKVCSSCSLRSSCEKAYLLTNKEDEARTIDVMRVLLTFGFDPVNGLVTNKSLMKQKSVKNVVRKLLHEVVKLSAVPIDPNLPPPVIKRPPPKVKQPPPPPKKRVGRDDIEMKKGDWLCPKNLHLDTQMHPWKYQYHMACCLSTEAWINYSEQCAGLSTLNSCYTRVVSDVPLSRCDFMNFAKNTVCLQCDAKRPKRQLLPGEWECPDLFVDGKSSNPVKLGEIWHVFIVNTSVHLMSLWRIKDKKGKGVPEQDGADVAAFEYADSPRMGQDAPLDDRAQGENFRGPDDDFNRGSRLPGGHKREYQDPDVSRPRMGFDDFDDEDDDVDNYELETSSSNPAQKTSSIDFSELEEYSGSEDIEGFDENFPGRHQTKSSKYNKSSRPIHRKAALSGIEDDELDLDSDEELSVNPKWKSSHVADSRQRGRGATGPSRGLSFGSDEELGLGSGTDDDLGEDFRSQSKRNKLGSGRRDRWRGGSDTEDGHFSESNDDDPRSYRSRANKAAPGRRQNNSRGRGDFDFTHDSKFRSNSARGGRRNSFNDDFNRSSPGSRGGKNRGGFRGNDYDGPRMSNRAGNFRDFNGPRRGQRFGSGRGGRDKDFNNRSDKNWDFDHDRPRRQRIIER